MIKIPRMVLLSIPAVIFLLLLAILIAQAPKKTPIATEVETTAVNSIIASPTPRGLTEMESLINDIRSFAPRDPSLTLPNIDKEITLPEE